MKAEILTIAQQKPSLISRLLRRKPLENRYLVRFTLDNGEKHISKHQFSTLTDAERFAGYGRGADFTRTPYLLAESCYPAAAVSAMIQPISYVLEFTDK